MYTSRVLKLSDFDYSLPEGAIAQTPAQPRDSSKLLVLDRQTGAIKHAHFSDLPQFLRAGDVLVRNNSKVIKARLFGEKTSGGKVEVLLNTEVRHDEQSVTWECLTKPGLKAGQQQMFGNSLKAECVGAGKAGYTRLLRFDCPSHVFFEIVEKIGQVPLPPYITSKTDQTTLAEQYQTTYAQTQGSVAAPTAGLHFTAELDQQLRAIGVQIAEVTLHVGLGTFLPVKNENITKHSMHEEWFSLSQKTTELLNQAKVEGRRIIAVGTTTTRVLESVLAKIESGKFRATTGSTNILIYPPYQFKAIDGLITNFHLPKSTLLMLVSAFVCQPNTKQVFVSFEKTNTGQAYLKALENNYRFFSFGDGMLII